VFKEEDKDSLSYAGTFADWAKAELYFAFHHNQFYEGMAILPTYEGVVLPEYDSLIEELKGKYGQPTKTMRTFTDGYVEGDGKEEEALKNGDYVIFASWVFADSNYIFCTIDPDQQKILLSYADKQMTDEKDIEDKANREKAVNDDL